MDHLLIESVEFRNLKALRETTLPLAPFTLLLGPNGSGKSTVLQALNALFRPGQKNFFACRSVGIDTNTSPSVTVTVNWAPPYKGIFTSAQWPTGTRETRQYSGTSPNELDLNRIESWLDGIRVYSLDSVFIAQPTHLQPGLELASNGSGLAVILEHLRDDAPERFESLNSELARWLPEYNRIILNTPAPGQKGFALRTRNGGHRISAGELSQGTLLAFALLTLAYLPNPPTLVGLEEPDRGIHPRLLRELRDALYRLSYPESCGENRAPVQVLVTTHSPYMLDLYRDHPEEIVLARKEGLEVQFQRVSDISDFEEILGDAPLSEVWYSGILGGVPTP